jgi:hypothetical protein
MGHFRPQRWTKRAQEFDVQLGVPSGALFPSRPALRISSYRIMASRLCSAVNRTVSENSGQGSKINARLGQSGRKYAGNRKARTSRTRRVRRIPRFRFDRNIQGELPSNRLAKIRRRSLVRSSVLRAAAGGSVRETRRALWELTTPLFLVPTGHTFITG